MQKDDATWLNIGYGVCLLLTALVSWKTLQFLGARFGWADQFTAMFQPASTIISLMIGGGVVYGIRANPERHDFLLGSVAELRKVAWPTWENTKKLTMIVCVVVVIFAVILMSFDFVWASALKWLLA